jgi:hypothetical protein
MIQFFSNTILLEIIFLVYLGSVFLLRWSGKSIFWGGIFLLFFSWMSQKLQLRLSVSALNDYAWWFMAGGVLLMLREQLGQWNKKKLELISKIVFATGTFSGRKPKSGEARRPTAQKAHHGYSLRSQVEWCFEHFSAWCSRPMHVLAEIGFLSWALVKTVGVFVVKKFYSVDRIMTALIKNLRERAHTVKKWAMKIYTKGIGYIVAGWSYFEQLSVLTRVKLSLIVAVAFLLFVATHLTVLHILLLLFFIVGIFFPLDSRLVFSASFAYVIIIPLFLIAKKEGWAEQVAIYAYYFLAIGLVHRLVELRRGRA